jgi:hypothetical protein
MIAAFIRNRSRTFWFVIAGLVAGAFVGEDAVCAVPDDIIAGRVVIRC